MVQDTQNKEWCTQFVALLDVSLLMPTIRTSSSALQVSSTSDVWFKHAQWHDCMMCGKSLALSFFQRHGLPGENPGLLRLKHKCHYKMCRTLWPQTTEYPSMTTHWAAPRSIISGEKCKPIKYALFLDLAAANDMLSLPQTSEIRLELFVSIHPTSFIDCCHPILVF